MAIITCKYGVMAIEDSKYMAVKELVTSTKPEYDCDPAYIKAWHDRMIEMMLRNRNVPAVIFQFVTAHMNAYDLIWNEEADFSIQYNKG